MGRAIMADDDWKRERDERLVKLGLRKNRDSDQRPRCIHCGQPFDARLSSGGELGICQDCIDG
jgi:transposase-like protein